MSESKKPPSPKSRPKSDNHDEIDHKKRLTELVKLMDLQGGQLEMLTERSKHLIQENKALRESQVKALNSSVMSSSESSKTKENRLLHDQCVLLSKDLENANNVIALKDEQLAEVSKDSSAVADLIARLEGQLNAAESEKHSNRVHIMDKTSATSKYRHIANESRLSLEQAKKRNTILSNKLKEAELTRDELENEIDQTSKKMKVAINNQRNLRERTELMTVQIETISEKLDNVKSELGAITFEKERLRNINERMESQLDLLKKKIENDKRENIKGKEGLQDIILARDTAEMKYTLLERDMKKFTRESKLETNKIVTATKEAMNRLVSTSEREALKHEHEKRKMISDQNQLKCSTRGIESELKSVISQRDSLEKLLAEKTSALLTINRQLKEEDTRNTENTQRLSELESNLTITKQQRTDAIEEKRNIECIIERDRTQFQNSLSQSKKTISNLQCEVSTYSNDVNKLTEKLIDTTRSHDHNIEVLESKIASHLAEAKIRESSLNNDLKQKESSLRQIDENYKTRIEMMHHERRETVANYDKKLHETRDYIQVSKN